MNTSESEKSQKFKPTETTKQEVEVVPDDGNVTLLTRQKVASHLRGILKANDSRDLTSELLEERRLEVKNKGF